MIKVALVGCGGIAQVHSAIINNSKDVKFISCCDTKLKKALELETKYGCKAFQNLRELLDYDKPDIVHICTSHYTHTPLTTYLLNKNINVFLEKPAVSNVSEIDTLINASENSKAILGVCFQNRYNSSSIYAKQLIESGETGKILGARCFVTWKRLNPYYEESDWRGSVNTEGASVLINQSIHSLDLMNWFLGKPVSVKGNTANHTLTGIINTEDTAEAVIDYENGARAVFYATVGYANDDDVLIDIMCENCKIRIEGDILTITYKDGRVETPKTNTSGVNLGKTYWGKGHQSIIEDFYDTVSNNKKFGINAYEATNSLKIAFEIAKNRG